MKYECFVYEAKRNIEEKKNIHFQFGHFFFAKNKYLLSVYSGSQLINNGLYRRAVSKWNRLHFVNKIQCISTPFSPSSHLAITVVKHQTVSKLFSEQNFIKQKKKKIQFKTDPLRVSLNE